MDGKQHCYVLILHPQCYHPIRLMNICNSISRGLFNSLYFHSEMFQFVFPILRLQWQLLLEPSIPNLASNSSYARAFQLLLERKRLSTFGITSYELHKKSGRMIFPASSSLFQCLDTGYNVFTFII